MMHVFIDNFNHIKNVEEYNLFTLSLPVDTMRESRIHIFRGMSS